MVLWRSGTELILSDAQDEIFTSCLRSRCFAPAAAYPAGDLVRFARCCVWRAVFWPLCFSRKNVHLIWRHYPVRNIMMPNLQFVQDSFSPSLLKEAVDAARNASARLSRLNDDSRDSDRWLALSRDKACEPSIDTFRLDCRLSGIVCWTNQGRCNPRDAAWECLVSIYLTHNAVLRC